MRRYASSNAPAPVATPTRYCGARVVSQAPTNACVQSHLEYVELGGLNASAQTSDLRLDPSVNFLDLEGMNGGLVSDATFRSKSIKSSSNLSTALTFLQVEIEADASRCPRNLFSQSLLQSLDIGHQSLVLCLHHGKVIVLQKLHLRFEPRKVDLHADSVSLLRK